MFSCNFPEESPGLFSPPHFVYDFSRIMFLMLYSNIWPNFTVSLPLFLEILGNICITTVYQPVCDVIKFEINLIFLINCFTTWPKNQNKTLNNLRTKRAFEVKWKAFFIILKGLLTTKNCLRPDSASLKAKLWNEVPAKIQNKTK